MFLASWRLKARRDTERTVPCGLRRRVGRAGMGEVLGDRGARQHAVDEQAQAGGHRSSRYSMMAIDSLSQKSPCWTAGTRPVTVCSTSDGGRPCPLRMIARVVANSRPFSRSATNTLKSNGLHQKASTNSVNG